MEFKEVFRALGIGAGQLRTKIQTKDRDKASTPTPVSEALATAAAERTLTAQEHFEKARAAKAARDGSPTAEKADAKPERSIAQAASDLRTELRGAANQRALDRGSGPAPRPGQPAARGHTTADPNVPGRVPASKAPQATVAGFLPVSAAAESAARAAPEVNREVPAVLREAGRSLDPAGLDLKQSMNK
ncbi:hypothetical protein [Yinghuangia sp. YIM S09857]|uniref:hypothetical protein n=1 Tax=Yinghuangia sp. YIM S09857 TaxID=3436929 RepID=UPI003F53258F